MKKVLFLLTLALFCQLLSAQNIIYVNHAATGANDGSSWANAFVELQPALDTAQPGDEVWVAEGTYYPSSVSFGNYCFVLKDRVAIYGGFVGTENHLKERDWSVNRSVLSGNLGDTTDPYDNSSFVVGIFDPSAKSAVLDGFVVSGGTCGPTPGQICPTGRGGINAHRGQVILRNLYITNNIGPGIGISGANVEIINTRVEGNFNKKLIGGAIQQWSGNSTIVNSLIGPNPNTETGIGLEIWVIAGKLNLYNSTIAGNDNFSLYLQGPSSFDVSLINTAVEDSVLIFSPGTSTLKVQNCVVPKIELGQNFNGLVDLGGNLDLDSISFGQGNFNYQSPFVNAGLNDSIPTDKWDMDYDGDTTEPYPFDFRGKMRVVDDTIDIGAFEYIPSYADTTFQTICNGDSVAFNNNYVASGGVYKQSLAPDSAQYLSLNVDIPNVDVTLWFDGILEAKADSVSYQWIDCNDTANDLGATEKIFYPTTPGDYAVIITTPNGCVDTSACYNAYAIGLEEGYQKNVFSIYPNPVKTELIIRLPEGQTGSQAIFSIRSISGQTLMTWKVLLEDQEEFKVNVESLPQGIYMIEWNGVVKRFVKAN